MRNGTPGVWFLDSGIWHLYSVGGLRMAVWKGKYHNNAYVMSCYGSGVKIEDVYLEAKEEKEAKMEAMTTLQTMLDDISLDWLNVRNIGTSYD